MKKTLLLLFALLTGVSGAWAESQISKAVAGTYLFDSSNPALTVNKGGATITNDNGAIIIHHDDLSLLSGSRTYAAVVMKVDLPTTAPGSFSQFINLKASNSNGASIGLGVTTEGKLKGTWGGAEWNGNGGGVVTSSAVTGNHTIVLLCNDGGTTIYVDGTSTSVNNSGLKGGTKWTDLRIESTYTSCVKSVYVFSGDQASNISAFFSELSDVVTVANSETKSVSENSTATRFFVASGGTLTADGAYDMDKIEGAGEVAVDADLTISGNIATIATGKLTINEGKTLTLGTGDSQTNSIESFSSIGLSGTIYHNNSKATLNNVTVPSDKTGKIFAFDMGADADAFKLAGTTTLNGNLTVLSKWNAQIKVDELSGSGTWLICGTTGTEFDDTKTQSNETAVVKVGSSPDFTGTIHEANSKSNLSIIGTLQNCTLKGTVAPDGYPQLADGAVLDGVILEGNKRIGTTGNVTIRNLAGNNLSGTSYDYAFIGSGTLNFEGTCDLTKKSDNSSNSCSKIGYASGNNIIIKSGANITASDIYNSSGNNAAITVEGTISATYFGGAATLAEGSNTTLSDATPFDGAVTVSGNATLNLTNATSALNQAITVAEGKTLTINGGSNTVNLTSAVSGSGNIVLSYFPTDTTHPTLTSWTGTFEFPQPASDQTNLTKIFNAWGNENSVIKLHSVTGWLEASITVNPTLNILNGATVNINNGYSDNTPVLKKLTGEGILAQTWNASAGSYALHIGTLTDFTGTLQGTNKQIVVEKLVLSSAPNVDTRLIKTSGTVTLENLYINSEQTTAYSWEKKTVEDVEGIYVSALDQVQQYRERAVAAIVPYFSYIGAGVGKYTVTLGSTAYTNTSDLEAAISGWATIEDCADPIITINQPTSAFYRIKSGSKYLQDARKSDSATQRTLTDAVGANESAETIFYLNDNTFVGYKTGFGFGFSVCQTRDTEHLNTQLFTESAEMGKYTIQSQQGTYTSEAYNVGYWGIDDSDLFRVADAASGTCWTIETVTSLPITLNAAGDGNCYATLCLPCDVTISGANAYTLSISGSWAVPTAVPDNKIPAGTPVLLKGTSETATATATINTGDSFGSAINNALTGTYAAIDISSTKGSDYYLGRYRDSDSDPYVVGFYHWDQNVLSGFRAYLTNATVHGSGVKGFAINWGGETGVEAIEHSPLTIDHEAGAMFDLSGRRVSKAQKGLYIQNGKKVMVK